MEPSVCTLPSFCLYSCMFSEMLWKLVKGAVPLETRGGSVAVTIRTIVPVRLGKENVRNGGNMRKDYASYGRL